MRFFLRGFNLWPVDFAASSFLAQPYVSGQQPVAGVKILFEHFHKLKLSGGEQTVDSRVQGHIGSGQGLRRRGCLAPPEAGFSYGSPEAEAFGYDVIGFLDVHEALSRVGQ